MSKSNDSSYTSKYGTIPILNSDNYSEWSTACELALVSAKGLDLVLGTEEPAQPLGPSPTANQVKLWESYIDRRASAFAILNGSIGPNYKHLIKRHIRIYDLPAARTDLRNAASRLNDRVFISKVRQAFNAERFSPPNQTVSSFVGRLREYANKIEGT